jgi:hypothetical protein
MQLNRKVIGNSGGDGVGGAGISIFDATVGAGGNYPTVGGAGGAIAAGKKRLRVVGNITETEDVIFPAGDFLVYIPYEFTWNMGVWSWESAGACHLTLMGERSQQETGSKIAWAHVGSPLIHVTDFAANSSITADGITWDNTSPNNGSGITSNAIGQRINWYINNCLFNIPNKISCGLRIFSTDTKASFLNNSVFVGAGGNANNVLMTDGNAQFSSSNIVFRGTFAPASTIVMNAAFTTMIDDWSFNLAANAELIITANNCSIHGLKVINAGALALNWSGDRGYLVDTWLNGGIFTPSGDDFMLTQMFAGSFVPSGTGRQHYTDMDVTNAATISISKGKFSGCGFLGGATCPNGALDNGFTNTQFGPNAGGSGLTLNIIAGALRTRVSNCLSDVAIASAEPSAAIDPVTNVIY